MNNGLTLIKLLKHIPKPQPFKIIYTSKIDGRFHPDSLATLHDARHLTFPPLEINDWFMNHTTAHRKRKEIDAGFYQWVEEFQPKTLRHAKAKVYARAKLGKPFYTIDSVPTSIALQLLSEHYELIYQDLYGDWLESPQLREHLVNFINQQNQ